MYFDTNMVDLDTDLSDVLDDPNDLYNLDYLHTKPCERSQHK